MFKKHYYLTFFFVFLVSAINAQNGLSFDGSNDKVDLGNPTALQITGTAITIEAWIYPTLWRTNVWEGGIVVKEMNSSNNGYMFRAGNLGRLNFGFSANGLPWKELTTAANTLTLNVWQHVAATYDGSKVRLYVDGIRVDSANYTGNIGNSTNNCVIGGWYSTGRNFPGKIDEVRIWNITRSGSQIANSMNGEFCAAPTGLVAYYKFNQGTAGANNAGLTTLTDNAGTSNGTLQGFSLNGATSNWTTGAALTPGTGGSGSVTLTECDSYTSPSGNIYTATGTYIDTVTSPLGCDSILTIDLTIVQSSSGSLTASGCNTYTSPSGNTIWTATGTYYDTLTNSIGCDSVITVNLTINNIDTNVLQNGIVLTSWLNNATYQWLDCGNAYSPIAGATSQTFIPTQNGTYAVEVSDGTCTDTSACYTVTGVGIDEELQSSFKVYPNPTADFIILENTFDLNIIQVELFQINGKKLLSIKNDLSEKQKITVDYTAGVYVLRVTTEKGVSTIPILIKH